MFRASAGYKAQYHYLTLMVVLDFDQWKILMQGPGLVIDGGRAYDCQEAESRASEIAQQYIHEEKCEPLPHLSRLEWTPLDPHACMTWRA